MHLLAKTMCNCYPVAILGFFWNSLGSYTEYHTLLHQLGHEGSVKKRKCQVVTNFHSHENVRTLQFAMQHSPGQSSRKAADKLGITPHSVLLICKYDFNMFS
jgi:hypothetical protein